MKIHSNNALIWVQYMICLIYLQIIFLTVKLTIERSEGEILEIILLLLSLMCTSMTFLCHKIQNSKYYQNHYKMLKLFLKYFSDVFEKITNDQLKILVLKF